MIVKISPSLEQIRWHVQAALNGFETLDPASAAECAKSELRALILYLDALDNTDDAVAILIEGGVKPKIVLEGLVGDCQSRD